MNSPLCRKPLRLPVGPPTASQHVAGDQIDQMGANRVPPDQQSCRRPVMVAVVDTGIDMTTPNSIQQIYRNPGETGPVKTKVPGCRDRSCNGVDDDGNGYVDDVSGWDMVYDDPAPADTHGHGTHISSLVEAVSRAVSGAPASCPVIKLVPIRYYEDSGSYKNLINTVRGFRYAARIGARVVNYSGGGDSYSASEKTAIEALYRLGAMFVSAAGNDGRDVSRQPYYPACYGLPNQIVVGSTSKDGVLIQSSNRGRAVDLAAVGLMVLGRLPSGARYNASKATYGTMSGTSQSTAAVTGLVAGLMYRFPKATTEQIKSAIMVGAKRVNGIEKVVRYGLAWAPGAVTELSRLK